MSVYVTTKLPAFMHMHGFPEMEGEEVVWTYLANQKQKRGRETLSNCRYQAWPGVAVAPRPTHVYRGDYKGDFGASLCR